MYVLFKYIKELCKTYGTIYWPNFKITSSILREEVNELTILTINSKCLKDFRAIDFAITKLNLKMLLYNVDFFSKNLDLRVKFQRGSKATSIRVCYIKQFN